MLVEIVNSDIHWIELRDLPIEELDAWLNRNHQPSILNSDVNGGYVVYADGHVERLPRDTTMAALKKMLTPKAQDN